MTLFSLGYLLTAPAGASGEAVICTVEAAKVLKNIGAAVCFPAGQGFKLKLLLKVGLRQIIPSRGFLCGDGSTARVETNESASSGERIVVEYANEDTASAQSCFILITGELG